MNILGGAVLLTVVAFVAGPAMAQAGRPVSQPNVPAAAKAYDLANVTMMKALGSPLTGDADHDFAAWMVPQHQGAIAIAKVELQYGKDSALVDIARKIVDEHEKRLPTLTQSLAPPTAAKGAAASGSLTAYQRATQTMTIKMNVSPTGDPDRDFVMLMLPHQDAGLSMAKAEIQFGKDQGLKDAAKSITQANPPRIAVLAQWQVSHQLSTPGLAGK